MLMQKVKEQWVPWRGEVIGNTLYPLNIEQLWPAEKLAAIGLYAPTEADVPEDKVAVDWTIEETKGRPVRTPVLAEKPTPAPTFEDRLAVVEDKLGIS